MGADTGLFDLMVKVSSNEIYILSDQEAKELKVVNNGRMSPEWTIEALPTGTYLKGVQNTIYGQGKLTFSCFKDQIIVFSFYQAGEKAKLIANGGWVHSLMVDEEMIRLPKPANLVNKGETIETLIIMKKTKFPFNKVMSAKSIGHAMQLSYEAPTFVGYQVDIDSKSKDRIKNYLGNCNNSK